MSLFHSPSIVHDSSLILCLDAACTDSYPGTGSAWTDLSNNNNHATLINSPAYSANYGGVLNYNGSTQYATTPVIDRGVITLEAFIYPTASPSVAYINSVIDCDSPGYYGTGFGHNNGQFRAILNDQFWNINTTMKLNVFQHCVMTVNATQAIFYVNGVLNASLNYTQSTVNSSSFLIGKSNANALYFTGYIPIVRIYNKVLTQDEVTQNFNALRKRFGI